MLSALISKYTNIKVLDFYGRPVKNSKEKEKRLILELYQMQNQYDAKIKAVDIRDVIKAFDLENQEEIILNNKIMWQVANIIYPCYNKELIKYIFQQKVEISTKKRNEGKIEDKEEGKKTEKRCFEED